MASGANKKAPASKSSTPPREPELSQDEVDAKAEMLFPPDVMKGHYYIFTAFENLTAFNINSRSYGFTFYFLIISFFTRKLTDC